MDPTSRQSIIDRISQANNVLITVKRDPTVDQLAACIGMTLFLNKLGKHATAVFSGDIPSTIEFLKPDDTIEKNTDSLRDFIIALDKSKADKLRYKVEDTVVKIFITPYRTSLSDKDLIFSQGDFNVDVVLALGIHAKEDLDQAIVAHGRILHDATVISMNNGPGGNLGTLHLENPAASSLCEMLVDLADGLKPGSFDAQMATAFLTGIVAETERFSNQKTSPQTMTLASKLMSAGANQQLIATQLEPGAVANVPDAKKKAADKEAGTLTIEHAEGSEEQEEPKESTEVPTEEPEATLPEPVDTKSSKIGQVRSLDDEDVEEKPEEKEEDAPAEPATPNPHILEPPTMGGTLTSAASPQSYEPPLDILGPPSTGQTLKHEPPTLEASSKAQIHDEMDGESADDKTLASIETEVKQKENPISSSPVANDQLEEARKAVADAAGPDEDRTSLEEKTGASFFDPDVQGAHKSDDLATQPAITTENASTPQILSSKNLAPEPPAPPAPAMPEPPAAVPSAPPLPESPMPATPAAPTPPPAMPSAPAPGADVMAPVTPNMPSVGQNLPPQVPPPFLPPSQ